MTILIGGFAAILFGIGDLLAGVGGRRDGSPNSPVGIALTASVVGSVLSGIYLFAISGDAFSGNYLYWAIAAAVFINSAGLEVPKGTTLATSNCGNHVRGAYGCPIRAS